jgi:predicted alpha/beta-fold hydrolase
MGGIVLANYCGVSGEENLLACAISLSGCYDCVANRHFTYSNDYWQPWLTQQLKTNFLVREPQRAHLVAAGIDIAHALSEHVRNVAEFDSATVVPYNGFGTVEAYYAAMSLAHGGKLARVAVPLLALHAVDDPIVDSSTFASAVEGTTRAAGADYNPNCWFRFTRSGGHVGWSMGNVPSRERWLFMHLAVTDFAAAVLQTT